MALSILYREDLDILLFSIAEYLLVNKRKFLALQILRLCKNLNFSNRYARFYQRFYKIQDDQDKM